jgi:lipoprotein-releasing system ATP-binding protein
MCYVVLANVSVHLKNTNFILLRFYNFSLFPAAIHTDTSICHLKRIVFTRILVHFYKMLSANGLSKKYGALTVVNNVSLTVNEGEIVSIMGASGAGKSTLLHLLGALDKPDAGSVKINGTELFKLGAKKQAQFRNKNMGFVFQFHHLLPEFSAIENVAMPLWISGKEKKAGLDQAGKMLEIVGLSGRWDNKPSELSGGEQQRVAIARALINSPALVMADEPTGNLDSANAQAIHQLFIDLRKQLGQTFVMITHNEELAAMTDRTLVMKDGKIVEEQVHSLQKTTI